jgi:hypothetical protein
MTQTEHIQKTRDFILAHPDLFADGDIFSSCPECENGGPGDPRLNGDVAGHRKFLRDEYAVVKNAFGTIGKKVRANYFSMNGDVARLIMDKETTRGLDGLVVIDHYVATPEKLVKDVQDIAATSGGRVVLGEWGVPIPDINGRMTEVERADWMKKALTGLESLGDKLGGMNYWLAVGGFTELWPQGSETSEVSRVLQKFYQPQVVYGRVSDEFGRPLSGAHISINGRAVKNVRSDGYFEEWLPEEVFTIIVAADGYETAQLENPDISRQLNIILVKQDKGIFFRLLLWLEKLK